jgi:hypothetical protein
MTTYQIKGKNSVSLTQSDFKAAGGEGSVYVKGSTAYKVYTDPKKMIPAAKIGELARLTEKDIIKPEDVLLDSKGVAVGYTMTHVPDAYALCQTFTKSFRDRNMITPSNVLSLVQKLQAGVEHVHGHGILIVDLNEMNFLVGKKFDHVYFIDVDSYQTKSFPATALMDSVKDRHCANHFTEGTDWFSFGIVAFQMFVGVHPYKGRHATLKTMDERMRANVSVLHKDVSMPATCYPLSQIPSAYRQWFEAVFERGERIPPPTSAVAVLMVPQVKTLTGSNLFDVELFFSAHGEIVSYFEGYTLTTHNVYRNNVAVSLATGTERLVITPKLSRPIHARLDGGLLVLKDLSTNTLIPCQMGGEQIMMTDGRLYVKQGGNVQEVEWSETPTGIYATPRVVSRVLENATKLFDGVAFQSMLGSAYATVFPRAGASYEVRVKELDGYQVVDARYQGHVLIATATKGGSYDKFILRFDDQFAYDVRVAKDIVTYGVNFVVLDSGICLHMNDQDEIELFSARRGSAGLKVVKDSALGGDCRLFKNGTQAMFARGDKLYKFSMKP